ncbi:hypothetical protein D3C76_1552550 [compost metagenome]
MAGLELAVQLPSADSQLCRQSLDGQARPHVVAHQRQRALHLAPLPCAGLQRAQGMAAVTGLIHQHVGQPLERASAATGI